jgi:hypothetical protein
MILSVIIPAGSLAILTGPGGTGVCTACISPFGAIPLVDSSVLWSTGVECGWSVPWGRYEVNGVPHIYRPTDFFAYLQQFNALDPEADLTSSAVPGTLGYSVPDGIIDNHDFFFFLDLLANP